MNVNAPGQIRFCDEYERLLEEFLHSLTKWKQAERSDRSKGHAERYAVGHAQGPAEIELIVAQREYVWALVELQEHSRECLLCEETLRAHVNAPDQGVSDQGMSEQGASEQGVSDQSVSDRGAPTAGSSLS